jgi:hypothetical protein
MTNLLKHGIPLFAIICLAMILTWQKCGKDMKPPTVDSLLYYKAAYDIEKKQHGNEQAILLNEIETVNRKLNAATNAKDSIREREIKLTNTNLTLMKKLRQTLPIECDTVFILCDEIINVKDSSYAALFDVFELCNENNQIKDSLIVSYQDENVTDSLRLDNSEKATEAAKKEARKQKRGKIAAWVVGVGLLLLSVVM